MAPFTFKYMPKNSAEIVGPEKALAELQEVIINYKKKKPRAAILYGPIGTGKTSSVYALAKELDYDLLEINSSDLRNAEKINSFLNSALGQQSLFFRPKLILIDEVDNLSGVKDRGCIPEIVKAIEKSLFPVIMTANDIYESKLKALKSKSALIEFPKIPNLAMVKALRAVCEQEGIPYEEKALSSLARQSDGDLRAALIDLQVLSGKVTFDEVMSLSDRKRTISITSSLQRIFKSSSAEVALASLDDSELNLDEIFLWIDENLPEEYSGPDLHSAYEKISRADLFRGRISRRQHWHFLVYINNLLSAGISSAKERKEAVFVKYRPPTRLLRIWQGRSKNAKKEEVAEILAAAIHASKNKALQHLPYLVKIIASQEDNSEFGFEQEQISWLKKASF